MRHDMDRVIVERPRYGYKEKHDRRIDPREDLEDLPSRGRMGRNWFFDPADLNDHLAPLRRFLEKSVGRPWDDVWSEVCAATNRRGVRGHHLIQHVRGWVYLSANEWRAAFGRSGIPPSFGFYVDDDGVLRKCYRAPRERKADWAHRRGVLTFHGENREFLLIDDAWCEVELAYVSPDRAGQHDAVTGEIVRLCGWSKRMGEWHLAIRGWAPETYARGCLYEDRMCMAVSKRRLSKQELAEHGL